MSFQHSQLCSRFAYPNDRRYTMPRWWLPFILSCCLLGSIVLADTEIRNIHFPLSTSSIVQPSGPVLDFTSGTRDFNVSSAAPELWLGWYPEKPYTSWTARVSWPASVRTLLFRI